MEAQTENGKSMRTYRVLTIASSLLLLSFTLLLPLSWNNEIYQSMASDLLRFHRLPYLGSWDQNFPGVVFIHAASILLFGNSAMGFHIFDVLIHVAMSWMLFQILLRWLPARSAWLATLLLNIRYISSDSYVGERDPFVVFFVLVTVAALFQINRASSQANLKGNALFAWIAGASTAMASMIRPTYLPLVPIGAVWLFLALPKQQQRLLFSYAFGAAIVFAAIFLPYVFHPGGLREFYLSTIRYNLDIYGSIRLPFPEAIAAMRSQKFYILFGLLGIIIAVVRRRRGSNTRILSRPDLVLIVGIGLTGVVSILVMGKYLPYHYELVMLILIPFCIVAIERLIGLFPSRLYRIALSIGVALFVLFRIAPLGPYRSFLANYFAGNPNALEQAQDNEVKEPLYRISVEKAVAAYLDRSTPSNEPVECATLTSGIRWRTERRCATRFTTLYPITMLAPNGTHPDFQIDWRKEYIDTLRSERPYYLVIANGPKEITDWIVGQAPSQSIHEIPGFDSLIAPHYGLDTTIGGYTIWKRKD